MKTKNYTEAFSSLSKDKKIAILMKIILDITIIGRSSYQSLRNQRLKQVNEVTHLITSHCISIMQDCEKSYPDSVFIRILIDDTEDAEITNLIRTYFDTLLLINK